LARVRERRPVGGRRRNGRPGQAGKVVEHRGGDPVEPTLLLGARISKLAVSKLSAGGRHELGDSDRAAAPGPGAGHPCRPLGPGRLRRVVSAIASDSFGALGTSAAVFVTDRNYLGDARTIVERELAAIDIACSRFRSDSELVRLNRARGRPVRPSPLFAEAIAVALRAAELSDGAVDPTVGRALRAIGYDRDFAEVRGRSSRGLRVKATAVAGWQTVRFDPSGPFVQLPAEVELDLGATAKALAADRAARAVRSATGCGVLVSLGGDLAIAGPPPGTGWAVRVTDDHAAGAAGPGETVMISGGALATSSTVARRWSTASGTRHHIVDPAFGDSAREVWRTVSVTAGSCVDANVAATTAIVCGRAAPAWLEARRLPSRLVRPDGRVVRIAGWPEQEARP
jgi:FAD:protein FMN transferase